MDVLCVAQYGEATWNQRERLFNNERMVEVKDDQGKPISSRADWTEQTYREIIKSFSEKDDFVYFPRIVSGTSTNLGSQLESNSYGYKSFHTKGSEISDLK